MRPTVFLMKGWARAPQNESNVPFKAQLPLNLKNRVSSKNNRINERGCLFEVTLVLSCLQKNNFENKYCEKEVNSFHQCYSKFVTNINTTKEHARLGILTPNTKNLTYSQINQLMRKYPHV